MLSVLATVHDGKIVTDGINDNDLEGREVLLTILDDSFDRAQSLELSSNNNGASDTEARLNLYKEILKGYSDIVAGRVSSLEDVEARLNGRISAGN